MTDEPVGGSFRDPSGYVFRHQDLIHRRVAPSYAPHYDRLMGSGLYEKLVEKGLLVAHREVADPSGSSQAFHRTLLPEQIPYVSYPYEWSFSQLRDAAITTLRVQSIALHHGMTLKDASAYNVQFLRGRPVLIDTLSFETYEEGPPWVAYRQFCQHFLAPLALMARRDVRLAGLLRVHLDGIPLDLASSLLPARAWLNTSLLLHIRAHARYQRRFERAGAVGRDGEPAQPASRTRGLSRKALSNLVEALASAVRRLRWEPTGTEWADYYAGDSYDEASLAHKRDLVKGHLERLAPRTVWDLGANTGVYSRIAAEGGADVVSFDVDPACVERNYREVRAAKEERILPLLLDLVNPSPALGWAHEERSSFLERAGPDAVLALALIHHIAISNNVPLDRIARFFATISENLLIEFVPKSDPKVRTLLATREDVFPGYTREGFERAFGGIFSLADATEIKGSDRVLYSMRRKP